MKNYKCKIHKTNKQINLYIYQVLYKYYIIVSDSILLRLYKAFTIKKCAMSVTVEYD